MRRDRGKDVMNAHGQPVMGLIGVMRRALAYWRPYWVQGVLIVLAMLLQQGFNTFLALSLKLIIDTALPARDGMLLLWILAGLAGGFIVALVANLCADYLTARVSANILNDLRLKMFSHLQRLSMDFFARAQTGNIVAHFSSDLADIEKGLTSRLSDAVLALIGLIVNVPLLFVLEWQLALLFVAALPLIIVGTRAFTPRASRANYQLKQDQGQLASTVHESVRAQPVVKVFGLQDSVLASFRQQLAGIARSTVRANFLTLLVGTASSLGVLLVQLVALGAGALLALHGHLTVGALVAFMSLLSSVNKDAYNLTKKVVPSLITATGGLQRIEDLLTQRPRVVDARGAQRLPRLAKEIRFEDVSFSYNGEQRQLDHISFTILAGETVAFVGPSGAGKSTILSLLARFYDVTTGAVTIDGHDLRRVTQESLRAQIGLVFQDTFLFNATIRDNIRMGKLDAADAQIEAAARAAEIHDLIMSLPRGYDTPTGELGAWLSGGQRQRIAIARAILRDPAILILDEATSALDPATETAIIATLKRIARHRTVVAVTHRLAAIHHADRIFVVDSGCVVEDGRHHELLHRGGLYHELWWKQNHGETDGSLQPGRIGEPSQMRAV